MRLTPIAYRLPPLAPYHYFVADDPRDPSVRVVDRRWWARGESAEPADEPVTRKPTVVEELEQRLADTAEQLQAVLTEHRRAAEEFEQVKLRIRREVAREVERGRRGVLVELLEVLDNLDRAIAAGRLYGLVHRGSWIDVGTHDGLKHAETVLHGEKR